MDKIPAAASCAVLVIAKTMNKKDDFREGKFLDHCATRLVPGDKCGYLSAGEILVVYGPDDEATAKMVLRRNPMLLVIGEGTCGKAKKAAPKGCVVLTLDKDADVSYKVVDGRVCSKAPKSTKWTPVYKPAPKPKAKAKEAAPATADAEPST